MDAWLRGLDWTELWFSRDSLCSFVGNFDPHPLIRCLCTAWKGSNMRFMTIYALSYAHSRARLIGTYGNIDTMFIRTTRYHTA